jgi:FtsH-binding integral membrane protein
MNSKTLFTICATYNVIVGLMLYFMAEQIALQSGAEALSLETAAGGNMNTGTAFLGLGILTFMIRGIQGSDAKNGLIGWGIGGSVIILELIYRMTTNDNFHPPLYFLISGAMVIAVSFYGSTRAK